MPDERDRPLDREDEEGAADAARDSDRFLVQVPRF